MFHRRTFMLGGLAGLGLLAMSGRLAQLQLFENGRYTTLAAANQFNFRMITPPRGRIIDRNGVELASNRPNFRLLCCATRTRNVDAALRDPAAVLIDLDDQPSPAAAPGRRGPRFAPVAIADDLSWDEFARINVRLPELTGLQADMGETRVYPFGGAFAHVIGYVSKVSNNDLKAAGPNPDPLLLNPGFRIGKQGVEKALDLELRGKPGGQKVEVDSVGRVIREDPAGDIKATPGKDVVLTLDADIQNRALEVFGEESGAAVMMDCRTGDILCLMSAPSFDANRFVAGLTPAEYQALAEYDHKPLFNKALTANYPPGSTFKTMVALTALEAGVDPDTVHVCGKSWFWGGRVWHCDKHHGALNMHDAIKTSCDIYFYQTALAIGPGPDRRGGAPVRPGSDLRHRHPRPEAGPGARPRLQAEAPSRGPGLAPRRDAQHGHRPGLCGRQRHAAVRDGLAPGQRGESVAAATDPLDRRRIAAVWRGGAPTCRSNPSISTSSAPPWPRWSPAVRRRGAPSWASARSRWPARPAPPRPIPTAAATAPHGATGAWELRDHAWFIAFAPYDNPRYAMSVLVEHGGFGAAAAAPKAREIMRVALLKDPEIRARIEKPLADAGPAAADAGRAARGRRAAADTLRRQTPTHPMNPHDRQRPDPSRPARPAGGQVRRDRLDLLCSCCA